MVQTGEDSRANIQKILELQVTTENCLREDASQMTRKDEGG
jgi:hypothetical protein